MYKSRDLRMHTTIYACKQGSYMSWKTWKTWKNIFVMECHGNVMEFYFSGKVMEMSWNFTKMSWKKYVFTNSIIRKKIYFVDFLANYIL